MNIIETIIKQQGEGSTTVQAMRQFFPVIEQAAEELQAERDSLRAALRWNAAVLKALCVEGISEFSRSTLQSETKTFWEILVMANDALNQQETGK